MSVQALNARVKKLNNEVARLEKVLKYFPYFRLPDLTGGKGKGKG